LLAISTSIDDVGCFDGTLNNAVLLNDIESDDFILLESEISKNPVLAVQIRDIDMCTEISSLLVDGGMNGFLRGCVGGSMEGIAELSSEAQEQQKV
jgi:hypothetical protein